MCCCGRALIALFWHGSTPFSWACFFAAPLFEVSGYSPAAVLYQRSKPMTSWCSWISRPRRPAARLSGSPPAPTRLRHGTRRPRTGACTGRRSDRGAGARRAGSPPVDVELGRVTLTPPRDTIQASAWPLCIPALADVQQAGLYPRPEPVDARRRRDDWLRWASPKSCHVTRTARPSPRLRIIECPGHVTVIRSSSR